jgi:hypothetical protein
VSDPEVGEPLSADGTLPKTSRPRSVNRDPLQGEPRRRSRHRSPTLRRRRPPGSLLHGSTTADRRKRRSRPTGLAMTSRRLPVSSMPPAL